MYSELRKTKSRTSKILGKRNSFVENPATHVLEPFHEVIDEALEVDWGNLRGFKALLEI